MTTGGTPTPARAAPVIRQLGGRSIYVKDQLPAAAAEMTAIPGPAIPTCGFGSAVARPAASASIKHVQVIVMSRVEVGTNVERDSRVGSGSTFDVPSSRAVWPAWLFMPCRHFLLRRSSRYALRTWSGPKPHSWSRHDGNPSTAWGDAVQ